MGRKIPARKHHGVRDPIKQNEKRLALLKDKINNPPEKRDYQKLSNKMNEFIKLKEQAKIGFPKKRKPQDDEDKPENYKTKNQNHRHNKELPKIRQYPNEDDEHYLRRVNRITRESIREAQFETKHGVEVMRNKKTGEITIRKRPTNQIDMQMKVNSKNHNKSDKMKNNLNLTIEEKRKLVKEMIRNKKKEKDDNQLVEYKRDEIKFGEVVQGPPSLVIPRLAQKAETVPRPGKKNLLLNELFNLKTDSSKTMKIDVKVKKGKGKSKDEKVYSTDLKGKRKDLSALNRQMIEQQQQNAVKLYRELKKNRQIDFVV